LTTREELAKEVSYCYIAHKSLSRREQLSGRLRREPVQINAEPLGSKRRKSKLSRAEESQKYIELIDYLIGGDNTYKYINNARLRSESRNYFMVGTSAVIQAKRYCSQIDEKLALIKD